MVNFFNLFQRSILNKYIHNSLIVMSVDKVHIESSLSHHLLTATEAHFLFQKNTLAVIVLFKKHSSLNFSTFPGKQ